VLRGDGLGREDVREGGLGLVLEEGVVEANGEVEDATDWR
jgi:hypothetical protein